MTGIVIIGSGLGGYSLARELRRLDPAVAITMVTADGGELYSKPMLSAAFAQGKDVQALAQKTARQMEGELGLTVVTRQRVTAIDRAAKRVVLGSGEAIAYGRLVLAMGADPRPYRVEGSEEVTVHTVNDLDDYAAWRDGLARAGLDEPWRLLRKAGAAMSPEPPVR